MEWLSLHLKSLCSVLPMCEWDSIYFQPEMRIMSSRLLLICWFIVPSLSFRNLLVDWISFLHTLFFCRKFTVLFRLFFWDRTKSRQQMLHLLLHHHDVFCLYLLLLRFESDDTHHLQLLWESIHFLLYGSQLRHLDWIEWHDYGRDLCLVSRRG